MYAALHLPSFALQSVLRRRPEARGRAAALLDGVKPRITEMNALAAACQVEIGMTASQALARCADLVILSPDPAAERAVRDCLLSQGEAISPFIEETAPGLVTIQLPPEKPLDEEEWKARVIAPLASLSLKARIGVASNPDFAYLAAQHADSVRIVTDTREFVSPLPVEALNPSPAMLEILGGWGIHRVGDLLALPMSEACDRLGAEAARLWEQAQGGSPRPLVLVKAPERFAESLDLEHPIETLDPLLFIIRRFLDQIAQRLEVVFLVAAEVKITLQFENGGTFERSFLLPRPTRSVDVLFRLLHTSLENFTSEAPITSLWLSVIPCRPAAEQFDILKKGIRDPFSFSEMIGRLQALVGADRVGTPRIEDSHQPDAVKMEAYGEGDGGAESDLPLGPGLLRFRPPIRAAVTVRGKRPVEVRSERVTGDIAEALGPWMGEGHWWDLARWQREEWDVSINLSSYRLAKIGTNWVIEGIYG
ncbi:MAG TPA: DNA polymerase Y family protein [Candidatus Methylacidiphilales bacterium]